MRAFFMAFKRLPTCFRLMYFYVNPCFKDRFLTFFVYIYFLIFVINLRQLACKPRFKSVFVVKLRVIFFA
jgi:hypothetical protein